MKRLVYPSEEEEEEDEYTGPERPEDYTDDDGIDVSPGALDEFSPENIPV